MSYQRPATEDEVVQLGAKALEVGWEWAPWMLCATKTGARCRLVASSAEPGTFYALTEGSGVVVPIEVAGLIPVLDDVPTIALGVRLVCKVWGEPSYRLIVEDEAVPMRFSWVDGGLGAPMADHPWLDRHYGWEIEGEAIVAALEVAHLAKAGGDGLCFVCGRPEPSGVCEQHKGDLRKHYTPMSSRALVPG